MNIEVLREFVCLAEDLNFTAAAKRCFITQSVLSKHIQNLEKELGVTLFIRDRQRVRLTPLGREFSHDISAVLEQYDEALKKNEQKKRDKTGVIKVSFLSGATHAFLHPAYENFLKKNPHADVTLCTMEGSILKKNLEDNKTDIAISMVFEDVNASWYRSYKIYDDFYGVVASIDHAVAKQDTITKEALDGTPIVIPNRERFREEWIYLRHWVKETMPNSELSDDVNDIVDFGILPLTNNRVVLAPSHIQFRLDTSRVKFIPLHNPIIGVQICAVWKNRADNPLVQDFVDSIIDVVESLDTDVLRNHPNES